MKLSLVVPCYNEEENIQAFYNEVRRVFAEAPYTYEIVFVNDGSKDGTLRELKKLYKEDAQHVTIVSFSRNFGKEGALLAGMKRSTGDMVTLIDADLQQRPEIARNMVKILLENEDLDCVAAYQAHRHESGVKSFFKHTFYRIMKKLSDVTFVQGASDFRTFRRAMADTIISLPEYCRFSKGIFSWVGYETKYIPYEVEERHAGTTKWSFWGLVKYAMEGFVSYTTFPLKLATILGTVISIGSIVYLIGTVIEKLIVGIDVPGYPTLVALISFLGGIQLLILGIMGEYLSRIYMEGKRRPIYIEKEVLLSKSQKSTDEKENT